MTIQHHSHSSIKEHYSTFESVVDEMLDNIRTQGDRKLLEIQISNLQKSLLEINQTDFRQVSGLLHIADAYTVCKKHTLAEEHYLKAITLMDQIRPSDYTFKCALFNRLCICYLHDNNLEASKDALSKGEACFRYINDKHELKAVQIDYLSSHALIECSSGNKEEGLKHVAMATSLILEMVKINPEHTLVQSITLHTMLTKQLLPTEACTLISKVYSSIKSNDIRLPIVYGIENLLFSSYIENGQPTNAREFGLELLKKYKTDPNIDKNTLLNIRADLINCLVQEGYLEKALDIADKLITNNSNTILEPNSTVFFIRLNKVTIHFNLGQRHKMLNTMQDLESDCLAMLPENIVNAMDREHFNSEGTVNLINKLLLDFDAQRIAHIKSTLTLLKKHDELFLQFGRFHVDIPQETFQFYKERLVVLSDIVGFDTSNKDLARVNYSVLHFDNHDPSVTDEIIQQLDLGRNKIELRHPEDFALIQIYKAIASKNVTVALSLTKDAITTLGDYPKTMKSTLLCQALNYYATFLSLDDQNENAIEIYEKTKEMLISIGCGKSFFYGHVLEKLPKIYENLGKYAEAERAAEECKDFYDALG